MSAYLAVNLCVIALPLLFSFDKRVAFWRKWPAALTAIVTVGAIYLAWDSHATGAGHWAFNPAYVGDLRLAGLPIEEWLFFVTVPYACLFTYECIRVYLAPGRVPFMRPVLAAAAVAAIILAFLSVGKGYAFLAFSGLFLVLVFYLVFLPRLTEERSFVVAMGIFFLLFGIVNSVLTGIPIVTYDPAAITGLRIGTIPIEDFVYNFIMLAGHLAIYRTILDRRSA
ncbi:MAG TPA: lycopene cyclase domain-containing protein [bacterium]|nr:lycopene cyclase domain-containing protein [bacterium]